MYGRDIRELCVYTAIVRRIIVLLASSVACAGDLTFPDTVDEIRAQINADLTPALAESRLGKPDAIEGSGLLIYRYDLKNDVTLRLGFPGYRPLMYAKLIHKDGQVEDLLRK